MRCWILVACFLLGLPNASNADLVLRDTIGPDSSWTDGMPGGSTVHPGGNWSTSAFVLDVPETGFLSEAQLVIFARDIDFNPENELNDIYGFSMDFHVWSDGINGGPDSFNANPRGFGVNGHTNVAVNRDNLSFINVEEWGTTGPSANPTLFTTFKVTIDLSSFGIQLQGGDQYVAAVIDPFLGEDRGALFRLSGSRAESDSGSEDLFRQFDTAPSNYPGYLSSQHGFGFEQYAARVTLTPIPEPNGFALFGLLVVIANRRYRRK